MTDILQGIMQDIKSLLKRVNHLERIRIPTWVFLTAPLTSVSWDGDARSTTAKTVIDLSSVFSAPAGIRAIYAKVVANDSGSAATTTNGWFILSPVNTAGSGVGIQVSGLPNDAKHMEEFICACDINGDVYFQCNATGITTLDIDLSIWGYLI